MLLKPKPSEQSHGQPGLMEPDLPSDLVDQSHHRYVAYPLRAAKWLGVDLVYHKIKISLTLCPPVPTRFPIDAEPPAASNDPIPTRKHLVNRLAIHCAGEQGNLVSLATPLSSNRVGVHLRPTRLWMGQVSPVINQDSQGYDSPPATGDFIAGVTSTWTTLRS